MGSIAISAAARAVYIVGLDPTDSAPLAERRRVIACTKNNLAPWPTSLAFRLNAGEDGIVCTEWLKEPCGLTANDLVGAGNPRRAEALEEATDLLRIELDEGARDAKEIEAIAKARGISASTLKRAGRGRCYLIQKRIFGLLDLGATS